MPAGPRADAAAAARSVIVATGLVALVDDAIRTRWPGKTPARRLLASRPRFGSAAAARPAPGPGADPDPDAARPAAPPGGVRGFFNRRPLRTRRAVAVY